MLSCPYSARAADLEWLAVDQGFTPLTPLITSAGIRQQGVPLSPFTFANSHSVLSRSRAGLKTLHAHDASVGYGLVDWLATSPHYRVPASNSLSYPPYIKHTRISTFDNKATPDEGLPTTS